uniref:Uncharacterized protein n=1 Tax=Rhizophora mucronata TaxID=61149 RepID=A0A2P2Q919_RHIMU
MSYKKTWSKCMLTPRPQIQILKLFFNFIFTRET